MPCSVAANLFALSPENYLRIVHTRKRAAAGGMTALKAKRSEERIMARGRPRIWRRRSPYLGLCRARAALYKNVLLRISKRALTAMA